jgi:hypothetical protein
MSMRRISCLFAVFLSLMLSLLCGSASAQEPVILGTEALGKVVPINFYYEGQIGPTQMRNAAAVSFGTNRHFVAALVDTSGYASNIRSRYEGFLIADAPVTIGAAVLPVGAYGFGVTEDGKLNIFDLGGKQLHSLAAPKDSALQAPRPLGIVKSGKEFRLYRGRNYVVLGIK